MMKSIDELQAKLKEVKDRISILEQEKHLVTEAFRKAQEDIRTAETELRLAETRFNHAVVYKAGTNEDTAAQASLLKAREQVGIARDKLSVCTGLFTPNGSYKKESELLDLVRIREELKKAIWQMVAEIEMQEFPTAGLDVMRRACAARGDDRIGHFALSCLNTHIITSEDGKAIRAELAQKYGLQ